MTGLEGIRWALTIYQPWAALIVDGAKDVENRGYPPPPWIKGQRIAIHAGKVFDAGAQRPLGEMYPSGYPVTRPDIHAARMAFVGTARVVGFHPPTHGETASVWHIPGQYGWILEERTALVVPVPCRGMQRFWRVPQDLSGLA